eukprot:m.75883 g.75883  ORF g.75883 m.75883 type:complete len:65 (+) comp7840_c0_seq1:1068-1262(+)
MRAIFIIESLCDDMKLYDDLIQLEDDEDVVKELENQKRALGDELVEARKKFCSDIRARRRARDS